MRPKRMLRDSRPARVAAGALMLAIPALGGRAHRRTGRCSERAPDRRSAHDHVGYGRSVDGHGTRPGHAPRASRSLLQFAPAGVDDAGRSLALDHGRRRRALPALDARCTATGLRAGGHPARLRSPHGDRAAAPAAAVGSSAGPDGRRSAPEFRRPHRSLDGHRRPHRARPRRAPPARSAGAGSGWQARTGRRWRTLGSARTGSRGGFTRLPRPRAHGAARPPAAGRVRRRPRQRPGDRSGRRLDRVQPERRVVVRRRRRTACGFHAGFGVANQRCPCGTQVTFRYGGRTRHRHGRRPRPVRRRPRLGPQPEHRRGARLRRRRHRLVDLVDRLQAAVRAALARRRIVPPRGRALRVCAVRPCDGAAAAWPISTWTRSTCRSSCAGARSCAASR